IAGAQDRRLEEALDLLELRRGRGIDPLRARAEAGIGQEAAAGIGRIAHALDDGLEHPPHALADVRTGEGLERRRTGLRDIALEQGQEEALLVAEGVVEAAAQHAGCSLDVLDRHDLVAEAPENLAGPIEHRVAVESSGTTHLRSSFACPRGPPHVFLNARYK